MPISVLENEEIVEPEAIRALLGNKASSLEVQKELAYHVIKKTDAPFVDFYIFEDIVHLLNDIEPDVTQIEGALPHHIWYALNYISRVRPDAEYSHEVRTYIKFIFKEEGIAFMPPWVEDCPVYKKVLDYVSTNDVINAEANPEDLLPLQAIHYLRMQEYLKQKN